MNQTIYLKNSSLPLELINGPFPIHGHGRNVKSKFYLIQNPETKRLVGVEDINLDFIKP